MADKKLFRFKVNADVNELQRVLNFVEGCVQEIDCSPKALMQINVSVEEIFVNIASYAYDPEIGPAKIRVEIVGEPLSVVIGFIDSGKPFNPLERPEPDTTLSAQERAIGGLGIFLVKKTMDEVVYRYEDGHNILSIKKMLR